MLQAFFKFEVFKNDPSDTSSLKDSRVERIYSDKLGDLWITTQGGLSKWNWEKENFDNMMCYMDPCVACEIKTK